MSSCDELRRKAMVDQGLCQQTRDRILTLVRIHDLIFVEQAGVVY